MNYRNTIGERVTRYDGKGGVIKSVDASGFVHILYDGDRCAGGYMYNPFLNEDVRFDNQELQKEIDEKLSEINRQYEELVKRSIAKEDEEITYYITRDNNFVVDKVYNLNCDRDSAFGVFRYVIHEQQKEFRRSGGKWHRLCLYDAKTKEKLAQES